MLLLFLYYSSIEAHIVLEYHIYNSIRDKFSSLFANVFFKEFRVLLQLNHQIDITLYLAEVTALRYSKESS
jgi:hypothetical protein